MFICIIYSDHPIDLPIIGNISMCATATETYPE